LLGLEHTARVVFHPGRRRVIGLPRLSV
jgi:hypothetical protein